MRKCPLPPSSAPDSLLFEPHVHGHQTEEQQSQQHLKTAQYGKAAELIHSTTDVGASLQASERTPGVSILSSKVRQTKNAVRRRTLWSSPSPLIK